MLYLRGQISLCFGNHRLTTTGQESSSSHQATDNNQVTSAGGAGSVTSGAGSSVNISTVDVPVVTAATATANNAIIALNNTANNAIANNTTTTANALQFGAEAVDRNAAVTNTALTANNYTIGQAFGFGAEALHSITDLATTTTTENNATLDHIANQLGQITANAAPQTPAAQQEILSGGTPIVQVPVAGSGSGNSNLETWALIASVAVAAFALFQTSKS